MGLFIAIIIVALILRRIYHKIFDITYFSFGAVMREFGICIGFAVLIVYLIGQKLGLV